MRQFAGIVALAATIASIALGHSQTTAQTALPYAPRMTAERVEALIDAWNNKLAYVPGEALVRFKPGLEPAQRTRALSATVRGGVRPGNTRWIGDTLWVRAAQERDADVLARDLARQPEVLWAQPNYLRRVQRVPNDPSYSRQWNLDLIDMPRAWDINPGATATVTVAIIDSGINTTTSTLTFPLWTGDRIENVPIAYAVDPDISTSRTLNGVDFVFWDGPVLDMDGHGTHVAGTALEETNNGLALAGVAYKATLLPLKVCLGYWDLQLLRSRFNLPGFVDPEETGFCDDAAVADATRFAANVGAQVINLSLGGPGAAPVQDEALRYAVGRGSFVAIAAGNGFEDGNPREYPAAYAQPIAGVVAVGAVGRSSRRAPYSTTGSYVELVAPGGDFDDGGTAGLVYQTGLRDTDYDPFTIIRPRFDRYIELPLQGTSMASPHVAGVAALLYSQGITRPAAIEAALEAFARDLGSPGRDDEYGYGLINARNALRGLGVVR